MSDKKIRLRFAPSPTGPLHMGGVRTALYSYLFAKQQGGDFVLRIEDTDQTRFVPGAEQYIIESLKWCGIEPNEGVGFGDGPYAPYRQSDRKPIYKEYAEQMVTSGYAYYAFDTAEEMDALRKEAEANKKTFAYDATTRKSLKNSLALGAEEVEKRKSEGHPYVIRLKVTPGEEISFTDLIRGEVTFKSDVVDDKVLLKADGMPTYHLAHIVDDYLMKITHAVRGEEWLPSAPSHILIYRYLGWEKEMPQYAHLPLLLKPEGNGKLSKRDGDRLGFPVFPLQWQDPSSGEISSGYREKGYYAQAFINMLAFLGWNPGTEQEIFSMDELVQAFSFSGIHKAGAKFDPEKAKWFNEQYLRAQSDAEIAASIRPQVQEAFGFAADNCRLDHVYLDTAVALMKPRVQFEHEIATKGAYLFQSPTQYDQSVIDKRWKDNSGAFFRALVEAYKGAETFTAETSKAIFEEVATQQGIKAGEVMQLFRVLVSGEGSGVDMFGMVALLGKVDVCNRIESALATLGK
jgi:glutamyl-tRNA synthetase